MCVFVSYIENPEELHEMAMCYVQRPEKEIAPGDTAGPSKIETAYASPATQLPAGFDLRLFYHQFLSWEKVLLYFTRT